MAAAAEKAGMSSARLERIDPVMQGFVNRGDLAGVSVRVNRRGRTVFSGYYGQRDKEAGLPITEDTIFRAYSMTKPVAATALMMLYEEGRFRLADPVMKYLPAFAATKVRMPDGSLADQAPFMEVRHLLMHTSGLTYDFLPDFPSGADYRTARIMNDPKRSLADLVDALAGIPLAFQPGSRWHYSVGIDVAARLVEVISGQSFGDFLEQRILRPLGMSDTAFGVPAAKLSRLAAMYGHPDLMRNDLTLLDIFSPPHMGTNERRDVSATYPTDSPGTFQRGGVGLFTTLGDYTRFAQMLCNGGELDGQRIIGRKTLDLMHSNHLPAALLPYELGGLPNTGWGFGLGSRVLMDAAAAGVSGTAGEYGWAGAAKTYYWVDPAEALVAVLMTQSMVGLEMPDVDLRSLVYGAIID